MFEFLREEMHYTCVAAGCSDFADSSKSVGLHKFSEDNESKRDRQRLKVKGGTVRVKNGTEYC